MNPDNPCFVKSIIHYAPGIVQLHDAIWPSMSLSAFAAMAVNIWRDADNLSDDSVTDCSCVIDYISVPVLIDGTPCGLYAKLNFQNIHAGTIQTSLRQSIPLAVNESDITFGGKCLDRPNEIADIARAISVAAVDINQFADSRGMCGKLDTLLQHLHVNISFAELGQAPSVASNLVQTDVSADFDARVGTAFDTHVMTAADFASSAFTLGESSEDKLMINEKSTPAVPRVSARAYDSHSRVLQQMSNSSPIDRINLRLQGSNPLVDTSTLTQTAPQRSRSPARLSTTVPATTSVPVGNRKYNTGAMNAIQIITGASSNPTYAAQSLIGYLIVMYTKVNADLPLLQNNLYLLLALDYLGLGNIVFPQISSSSTPLNYRQKLYGILITAFQESGTAIKRTNVTRAIDEKEFRTFGQMLLNFKPFMISALAKLPKK